MAGIAAPVIAGLAAGIAFFLVFSVFGNESLTSIGRLSVSLATPDGGVRPEYNLQINKIDNYALLARNDGSVLKRLIEKGPANPFYNPPYEDNITKKQAKQLMQTLQFSNITSYVDPANASDDFRAFIALVQVVASGEESKYYRITMFVSGLPDKAISSFDIVQASPPR